jgi:hypothetical protein
MLKNKHLCGIWEFSLMPHLFSYSFYWVLRGILHQRKYNAASIMPLHKARYTHVLGAWFGSADECWYFF